MNTTTNLFLQPCDESTRNELNNHIKSNYFFVDVQPIGKSVLGRAIECYTIGNSSKKILLCGAFHGMEWITSFVLYKFIINICDSIINHKSLQNENLWEYFSQHSLAIIPCVNPDGVEISINGSSSANNLRNYIDYLSNGDTLHWQSNAMGVDLNHNFNADWQTLKAKEIAMGITSPCATRYGGAYAHSEAETKALVSFCRHNSIALAVAFHTQGEEIYWHFGNSTPAISRQIAENMATLSGYTLSTPESIATGGGFKDWLIDKLHIPAFTVELGKGKNPLKLNQLQPIYDKTEKMLLYLAKGIY
ncbi:MAG: M14 family metallocarboxypeptidase [Acutalibacteraceae bacterium]|nr:M14 family metallocarboxypeptidase [Acutalibacteraceae bacterium]